LDAHAASDTLLARAIANSEARITPSPSVEHPDSRRPGCPGTAHVSRLPNEESG
jgi:hypothetical protein